MARTTEIIEAKLSRVESQRLRACEKVIRSGLKSFVKVGNALIEIRDAKLYRATHDTFADYVRERWGFKVRHAYRLCDAAEVVTGLPENVSHGTQINERQARELALIRPSKRAHVIERALAINGRLTAKLIRQFASEADILRASREIRNHRSAARRAHRLERLLHLSKGNGDLPSGKFSVVLADPPWPFDFSKSDRTRIDNHYPAMSLEEIQSLPVEDLCADDSALLLWSPGAKLAEALEVMEAWGFKYRTNAVWVKPSPGLGIYFRHQHELLLLGIRGSFPAPEETMRESSVIHAPRNGHSRKPSVHEMIERYWPGVPKLEMFCRGRAPKGWASWGNEAQ